MSELMEVDVLMLCAGDQQQNNDEDILVTITDELTEDQAMTELAIAERPTFDEERVVDNEVFQCDEPVMSPDEITPDDNRFEGVAPVKDSIEPFQDPSDEFSDVCVLPETLCTTTRSDIVELEEEERCSSIGAAVDRRNFTDCAIDVCSNGSDSAVDCVLGSASQNECDWLPSANIVSETSSSVTADHNDQIETASDTGYQQSGHPETSSVRCAETTSASSVIDSYASNVISDVDSTLIVSVPDTESAGNASVSYFADAVSADNNEQTNELSDDAIKRELAEAIDIEAKKKGFRVRFHEDHVTGYHDPPTPWREAELCSTPELLAAYRESCKQMGVKPLNKLVQQLEAISDFEERHELLSLKGEAIDGRVCETLEEIFRRVRFRSIDLEATSLDEESDEMEKKVTCRFDWHQTASAVTISVYAKVADPTKTTVEVNKVTAKLNIVFDAGNCYFNKSFILRGVIDPSKSRVNLLGTKVEVNLKKMEPGSWSSLELSTTTANSDS